MREIDNMPESKTARFAYETPELTAYSASEQLGIAVGESGCLTMYEDDGFDF